MKKLDKITSLKIAALSLAGLVTITGLAGCKKNDKTKDINIGNSIVSVEDLTDSEMKKLSNLLPGVNKETLENATLVILLDKLAPLNENGQINADNFSKFKGRIDSDNMINDFNSVQSILIQAMIDEKSLISTKDLFYENDSKILGYIESIVSNLISGANSGNKDVVQAEYNKLKTLFVDEKDYTVDGFTFGIWDLSDSAKAFATMNAQVATYYAKSYVSNEDLTSMESRTHDQNNKAYIKSKLEVLRNMMNEESKIDIQKEFNDKYNEISNLLNNKISVSNETVKDLIKFMNLKYLSSDSIATKDRNSILGNYDNKDIEDALLAIDAICNYNLQNSNDAILFSNFLLDSYKKTESGKIDVATLDFTLHKSIMTLKTVNSDASYGNIDGNGYFKNLYKVLTKQNFTHEYYDENKKIVSKQVSWQNISDGVNFVDNEMINYTLSKLPNIKELDSYKKLSNENLIQSIQYIQNVMTGECRKVDFVK